jgi:hypothetical protein
MNTPMPELPPITENERTPLVDVLLEVSAWKDQRIEELEQEILKLKGEINRVHSETNSFVR